MKVKSILIIFICVMTIGLNSSAQNNQQYIRIAKLVIDSAQLEGYKEALAEHAQTAVRAESGVLMLYAVYEKIKPTNVTVFEIYADDNAYKHHIKTAHFLKYKEAVKNMVQSLELVDVYPIALESKNKVSN